MSNLTALEYIQENSQATPGLFNQRFSTISANLAALNSDVTLNLPSGETFSIFTNIETSGGAHFQFVSIGSTPASGVTTAGLVIAVNSAHSDYIHFTDSSAAKSDYVLGSRAGGQADGLALWDASGDTMIVNFSKQSIRFFQNVVGPVFDTGGALADTYNAATFVGSGSSLSGIQAAINQASIDGVSRVYLPASMYPYSASSISFIYPVQMVREGGNWSIHDVQAYGASGDGVTDDTIAIRSTVSAVQAVGLGVVDFSSTSLGYKFSQIFITGSNIVLQGHNTKVLQIHDAVNSVEVVSGNSDYKVSAAFHIQKTATRVRIEGFDFTSTGAFPVRAAGFGSYFPSIAFWRSNFLDIVNNRFRGGLARGVFAGGGQGVSINNNQFENVGVTVAVAQKGNVYFYDPATDESEVYSSVGLRIVGNVFDGYSTLDPAVLLHATGCDRFSITDNKLLNISSITVEGIRVFSSDYGPHSSGGTRLDRLSGSVHGNDVFGTFVYGIDVSGFREGAYSNTTWDNSLEMAVDVHGNNVRGSGIGLRIEHCKYTTFQANKVKVSGSPVHLRHAIHSVSLIGNRLESTSSGQNATTIFGDSNLSATNLEISGNHIVTPTGDQFAFRTTSTVTGLTLSDNYWDFNSDVAACRPLVLTLDGHNVIRGNRFDIDTDAAGTFLGVVGGNSNKARVVMDGNSLVTAIGSGSTNLRGFNFFNCNNLVYTGNNIGGALLVEDTEYGFVHNNTAIMPSGNNLVAMDFDNGGYAQKALVAVAHNWIEMPAALNSPCIRVISNNSTVANTVTKCSMNHVIGNSNGVLIQQTTEGSIEAAGNTITNNGSGGENIGLTGSAVQGLSKFTIAAATTTIDAGLALVFRASGLSLVYKSGATIYDIGSGLSGTA